MNNPFLNDNYNLIFTEYMNGLNKKNRLFFKSLISIFIELIEVITSIIIYFLSFHNRNAWLNKTSLYIIIILLSAGFYFFIWSLFFIYQFFRNQSLLVYDFDYSNKQSINETIINNIILSTKYNRDITIKLSRYNELIFIFTIITSISFSLFCISSIIILNY